MLIATKKSASPITFERFNQLWFGFASWLRTSREINSHEYLNKKWIEFYVVSTLYNFVLECLCLISDAWT
jgi:hypothetical protein